MQATSDWFIFILLQVQQGKWKPFCFPNTEGDPHTHVGIWQRHNQLGLHRNYIDSTEFECNCTWTQHGNLMNPPRTAAGLLRVDRRSWLRSHLIWMQGYINDSIKGIFILVFAGHASLRDLGECQQHNLLKKYPQTSAWSFQQSQLQKHVWMRPIPITQPSFQAYRSADTGLKTCTTVSIIPQFHKESQFPCTKTGLFFHSSMGIRSLKHFFSAFPLYCYSQEGSTKSDA